MKLNRSPPALPTLSLADLLVLEEGCPSPCFTRTATKSYKFRCWFAVTETFTKHLLSWCIQPSIKNNALIMLWRNVTWFLAKVERMIGKVDWGDLPPEVWGEIGKRLGGKLDILRFRSVSEKLRASLPSPTRFPLRVPPPPNCDPELLSTPFFITEVSIYRSKGEWGTFVFEEVDQGGKFLGEILCADLIPFPDPIISFMASEANTVYPHFYMAAKGYQLRRARPRSDPHQETGPGQWEMCQNQFVKRMVIVSSSNGVNPSCATASDLCVVAHLSRGTMRGRLALLRLGGDPRNWAWDTDFCSQVFVDIATYRGRLCTLDHWGRVFLWDYNFLQMTRLSSPWRAACKMKHKYLFESFGELYLADFGEEETPSAVAGYRLCLRPQKWIEVDIVGGALFDLMPVLVDSSKF